MERWAAPFWILQRLRVGVPGVHAALLSADVEQHGCYPLVPVELRLQLDDNRQGPHPTGWNWPPTTVIPGEPARPASGQSRPTMARARQWSRTRTHGDARGETVERQWSRCPRVEGYHPGGPRGAAVRPARDRAPSAAGRIRSRVPSNRCRVRPRTTPALMPNPMPLLGILLASAPARAETEAEAPRSSAYVAAGLSPTRAAPPSVRRQPVHRVGACRDAGCLALVTGRTDNDYSGPFQLDDHWLEAGLPAGTAGGLQRLRAGSGQLPVHRPAVHRVRRACATPGTTCRYSPMQATGTASGTLHPA